MARAKFGPVAAYSRPLESDFTLASVVNRVRNRARGGKLRGESIIIRNDDGQHVHVHRTDRAVAYATIIATVSEGGAIRWHAAEPAVASAAPIVPIDASSLTAEDRAMFAGIAAAAVKNYRKGS